MSARKTKGFHPLVFVQDRYLSLYPKTSSHFINCRLRHAKNLYRKDLKAHFGCVNAVEFSHNGRWLTSGGDDRRVLLWDIERALSNGKPNSMKAEHHSNIFSLSFDHLDSKIFSGGNDEQVTVHDVASGETLDVFLHQGAVYGLSVDPVADNLFATACDDGRILIYDTRAPPSEDPLCLANYTNPMHAVMYNPAESRLLATANSKEGLGLWDIRKPKKPVLRYGGSVCKQSCMSVRFNQKGDRVIGLRRRLPPVMYDIHAAPLVCQFDHPGYYNSCTMKSCCFAGQNDEFLVSGSDDFNVYVWRIPDDPKEVPWMSDAQLVLKGHRSIVNQVRYDPTRSLIVSSGVEKVIKVWSPFNIPGSIGNLLHECKEPERQVFSHEEYINLVLNGDHVSAHDYSQQSTEEDPRMMAFFDSLVQRELEPGLTTDDSLNDSGEDNIMASLLQFEPILQSSGSSSSDEHSEGDPSLSPMAVRLLNWVASEEINMANGTENSRDFLDMDAHNEAVRDTLRNDSEVLSDVQSPSSQSRRPLSISDLTMQKRTEYMNRLMSEQTAERSKKRKERRKIRTALLKSLRRLSDSSAESDSDNTTGKTSTSDSDEEGVNPNLVLKRKSQQLQARVKRLRAHLNGTDHRGPSCSTETPTEPQQSTSKESTSNGVLCTLPTPCDDCPTCQIASKNSEQFSDPCGVNGQKGNGANHDSDARSNSDQPLNSKFKRITKKKGFLKRKYRNTNDSSSDKGD